MIRVKHGKFTKPYAVLGVVAPTLCRSLDIYHIRNEDEMVQTSLDPNSKPVAPVKADNAQQLTCKVLKAQYHKNSLKVQRVKKFMQRMLFLRHKYL